MNMISISLNGEALDVQEAQTVAEFLSARGFIPPYAVALNQTFLPRDRYSQTIVVMGDALEVVQPVTGG
jgi:sulfur carrier protein